MCSNVRAEIFFFSLQMRECERSSEKSLTMIVDFQEQYLFFWGSLPIRKVDVSFPWTTMFSRFLTGWHGSWIIHPSMYLQSSRTWDMLVSDKISSNGFRKRESIAPNASSFQWEAKQGYERAQKVAPVAFHKLAMKRTVVAGACSCPMPCAQSRIMQPCVGYQIHGPSCRCHRLNKQKGGRSPRCY